MTKAERHKEYMRTVWYPRNRKKQIDRVRAVRVKHREDSLLLLKQHKVKCVRCGEDHPACLDFHHKDPKQKSATIGRMVAGGWPAIKVLEEIKKCEVLCSNCHRKEHWNGRVS